jgi:DNA-binding MarR family transcriptional regulator
MKKRADRVDHFTLKASFFAPHPSTPVYAFQGFHARGYEGKLCRLPSYVLGWGVSEDQARNDPARSLALAGELRVVIGKLRRRFREQADAGDFTWTQKSVLVHLEREGAATVTALARAEGVRPQSMGAVVAALEAAGHIAGAPDPNDGRQTILSLTAACREWIRVSRAAREDWLSRAIRAKLGPDEQEHLASAVELLNRLADS